MASTVQLDHIPFFSVFSTAQRERLAEQVEQRSIPQGDFIVHQYDAAKWLFFLLRGRVQLTSSFGAAQQLILGSMYRQGDCIGWSALRPPYRYTASVRSEEDSEILVLEQEALLTLMDEDPRLACTLLRQMAHVVSTRLESMMELLLKF